MKTTPTLAYSLLYKIRLAQYINNSIRFKPPYITLPKSIMSNEDAAYNSLT
jgi:hypothetical protein